MAFVDECVVQVQAGRGGRGSASLRSEPFTPRGGPDGGNGGAGGSVVFEVSTGVRDLSWLADHPHQRAEDGRPGRSSRRDGAAGEDLVVPVPSGTVVRDEQGVLADLVGEAARVVVARGGRGGRGNAVLASPRRRLPRNAEPGEEGESRRLQVELRSIADLALVGLPNAGKSTLLSRLTAARPKIADYPFTTLAPNLGVTDGIVIADVPGLIEGAHEGRGLGDRFLRHVRRCRALALVVDLAAPDPEADLASLRAELVAYEAALAHRPTVVVGTKADLVEDPEHAARALDPDAVAVSALEESGMGELATRLRRLVDGAPAVDEEPTVVLRPGRPRFTVEPAGDRAWHVRGRSVERWVLETDLDDDRQVEQLQRRLRRTGVERRLAALGARHGDEVRIADRVFEFQPDPEGTD